MSDSGRLLAGFVMSNAAQGHAHFLPGPARDRSSPLEVFMTTTMCDLPAAGSIDAVELADLTELVRGHDQRLLDRVMPLVRRQSLSLDLSPVRRIDAAGISALVSLYSSAREFGHRFTVFNASPRVAEILAIVGLDRILMSQYAVFMSHSGPFLDRTAA
jgi:anti-anti-sigma factor